MTISTKSLGLHISKQTLHDQCERFFFFRGKNIYIRKKPQNLMKDLETIESTAFLNVKNFSGSPKKMEVHRFQANFNRNSVNITLKVWAVWKTVTSRAKCCVHHGAHQRV